MDYSHYFSVMKTPTLLLLLQLLLPALIAQPTPGKLEFTYIAIDSTKQKWGDWSEPEWLRYFGLDFGDVNRDGLQDLVSGRYVYHNPGAGMNAEWKRYALDENVDAIFFINVDDDPFGDIIAQSLPDIYWYEALDEKGTQYSRKLISRVPATSHVNSQGFEKGQLVPGGKEELLIAGNGNVYCISVPEDTRGEKLWPTFLIGSNTSDEGIGVGDLDGDGDLDISCGRRPDGESEPLEVVWFENPGSIEIPWEDHAVGQTQHPVDRVEIGDLDGDAQNEIVITEERYPGLEPDANLYWFGKDGNGRWIRNCVVTQYSMNNLDLADLNKDGKLDIITNEHKGPNLELQAWLNDGHASFTKVILDKGKENHLGSMVVDIDNDGDQDIIGAAWDHYNWMHLWRNEEIRSLSSGMVFREYGWKPVDVLDHESFLRVGGKLDYNKTPEIFTKKESFRDGAIRIAEGLDTGDAIAAELILERVQSHEDTRGLRIQVNDQSWIEVPPPASIPAKSSDYMFHDYPSVKIPLDYLGNGILDLRLKVDDQQKWNWPQNLIYGITLRLYYENTGQIPEAEIAGIQDNGLLGESLNLRLESGQLSEIARVEYFGFYEDVNWQGDGIYRQWQYNTHQNLIRNHIGSTTKEPFALTWNTEWIPDQDQDIILMARVETRDGLVYMTKKVGGLKLDRDYSVRLLKPYRVPANWATREKKYSENFFLDFNPTLIRDARMYWRSWSPCYSAGITLNGIALENKEDWPCYDYFEHVFPLEDPGILKQGENELSTLLTPLHDGKMVHGMEVQWPGIMLKTKVEKGPDKLEVRETTYEGKPHYMIDTKELRYYFDREGGGFSRMIDRDGNDWISFKREPWNEYPASAASAYRGLPNLVYGSDDGGAGHPGHDKCTSWIEGDRIFTESKSGNWKWSWQFFDSFALLEVLKVAKEQAYWFLYEGTPGGAYQPERYYFGTSSGESDTLLPDFYMGKSLFSNFNWMYAGVVGLDRVLYMLQLESDTHEDLVSYLGNSDQGVASSDGMTVFGFGRDQDTRPLLTTPQKFLVGFYPHEIKDSRAYQEFVAEIDIILKKSHTK